MVNQFQGETDALKKMMMRNFIDLTLHDNKKVTISKRYIVLIEPLENGKTRLTVDIPGSKDTKHFFTNEIYLELIKRLD